jgi:hypothetical protein
MSLVFSEHVEPTSKRNNVHYYAKADAAGVMKPAMTIYLRTNKQEERMCPNCFRTAFSSQTEICPRCGSQM